MSQDPLDRLAELMERSAFAEKHADNMREARNRQREHSHLATCAENVNAEDEHDSAVENRNDLRHDLCKALRNAGPALVAIARAAREVLEASSEVELESAVHVLFAAYGRLTPTQPEQK